MMRKIFKVFCAAIAVAVGSAVISGCSLLPKYRDPKSMDIDGKTYVTGFYKNLWTNGIPYREDETADFESRYHHWWKVEGTPFDLYCAENKEALIWAPAVYCAEEQFDAAKAYYESAVNYDYYIGIYLEDDEHVEVQDGNRQLLERAVSTIMQFEDEKFVGGLFDPYKDYKVEYDVEFLDWLRPTAYRVSKDGLFTTIHLELAIYNDRLYIPGATTEDNLSSFYDIFDDETSDYITSLFKQYNFL